MEALKFKLVIAYDGTAYQGWQVQKIGTGVQEKIEAALGKMFPSVKRIHSSSRTDTGVHALGMVAHVEIPRAEFKMPAARLALALNAFLPDDIRVLSAVRVPEKFHARFGATGKQYRYFIWNHPAMNPLMQNRAWHFPVKLDLAKMRAAAKWFLGRHDFKSFAGTRSYEMKSNVRTLTRCDIKKSGAQITLIIEGDGFLYKMCRGIVGTLAQVGQGKIPPARVEAILASRDRRVAGMTAPAHGLVLWRVFYSTQRRKGAKARSRENIPK
ncbi:MAG TPA: tRNA pseudouridine(38-40) synthase TruA [Candidatus Paceibacterota bacterium]|nr:tRNA pseudouridine(38-40) synthase TruA [Candidatus Paceibacterota bacterium]